MPVIEMGWVGIINLPGVAASVALSVPGSASEAGMEPSIDGKVSLSGGGVAFTLRPRLVRARAIELWSTGRLASWWNTLRLRIIV